MDVVRLGPVYSTTYKPDELIEGYSSMVWTERFPTPGEFELKTPFVEETKALLPEDTLISHLETDDVAIVENLSVSDDSGTSELTVTGRSLTSFLENRFIEGAYQKKRKMARNYSPAAAAAVLLWNVLNNSSGKDVTHPDDKAWTTLDKIPNVSITDSAPASGSSKRWWVTEGMLLDQLQKILDAGDMGLRVIRPTGDSSALVCSVQVTPLAGRGTLTRTNTTGITSLRFDIYKGLDRTVGQSVNPQVAFNHLQGHIDKGNYLFSTKDFKTSLEIMSNQTIGDVYRNATEQAYSGLRRRVAVHDAGSPEKDEDKADFKDDAKEDAKELLKKQYRRVRLFSGDISPIAPYQFKTHYNLGDLVTLYGRYDQIESMMVSEYVRTEDVTGDRGLPGLTVLD